MRTRLLIGLLCIAAAGLIHGSASAQFGIQILTDASIYTVGRDEILISINAYNYTHYPGIHVDVHEVLITPDGTIYELPDFNTEYRPYLSNVYIPHWFTYWGDNVASYAVGDPGFPASSPGDYHFAAVFTEPGALNPLCDIKFSPFEVVEAGDADASFGGIELCQYKSFDPQVGDWTSYPSVGGHFCEVWDIGVTEVLVFSEGDCEVYAHADKWGEDPFGKTRYLDAGPWIDMLGGPGGDVRLNRTEDSPFFTTGYWSWAYELGYSPGTAYTFVGNGGPDVGPFSASVVAPSVLDLYAPAFDGDTVPVIDRGQDYQVVWDGKNDGEIIVEIFGFVTDPSEPTGYLKCKCRFDDDGEGTIPSSVLRYLPPGGLDSLAPPDFTIERRRVTEFSADGLTEGGTVGATSYIYDIVELR